MHLTTSICLLLATSLALSACGEGTATDSDTTPCPVIEGETHLAAADSDLGNPVMIHVMGTECLVVGPNTMAIHHYDPDKHNMAAPYQPAHGEGEPAPELVVQAVRATMPSMGHGTHEPPTVHEASNEFGVNFQMAGQWQIEIDFYDAATAPVTDTVSFAVTVH